jgi:tetraacyldisaccharide 4'-kinase
MKLRNEFFDRGLFAAYAAPFPVISVGNLTAGGNSKTPLTMYLVQELRSLGYSPFVISRGYGGSERGPKLVESTDDALVVGDEPLLIKRKCQVPVVVSRSRVAGARFAAAQALGDVAVLDDAFQHRWLKRTLDIVSIHVGTDQALQAFLDGECLPKGRFRESRDAGLRRAGALVLSEGRSKVGGAPSILREQLLSILPKGVPVFSASLSTQGIYSLRGEGPLSFARVGAFCAIAHPRNFFDTLRASGVEVTREFSFADHYPVGEKELARMRQEVGDLPLVCTEKDAVRISEQEKNVFVLRTGMSVEPASEFRALLLKACERTDV